MQAQRTFSRVFTPTREFRFSFNWLKISTVWMLIVFGFYGWGTPKISALTSIPSVLINLSIVIIFLLYFVFGDRFSTVLNQQLLIKGRQIYAVLGIWIVLCVINMDWIFRALTGDEIAYALQSQGQSYVIVRKLLGFFPQLGGLPFRLLIQIFSAVMLFMFFLAMRLISKLKSMRSFILLCFIGTIILRIATLSQGGFDGPNPPGASFYYLVGSTILQPTNVSYRILSLLLASLFLAALYEYLRKNARLPEYIRVLILAGIISLPIFRHMSLIVEISIWTFYFASIVLLQLYRARGIASYQQIFVASIATTFRFPLVAIVVPLVVTNLYGTMRNRKSGDLNSSYWPSILGALVCLPGIILVSSTRLVERFSGADLTKQQVSGQFTEVGKITRDIFSTLSTTTNKVAWLIGVIGILLYMGRSKLSAVFLLTYLAIQYVLYFVLNNADLAYASKYIIEWFGPLVVLGLVAFISKLELKKSMSAMLVVVLLSLVITNVMDYNRIPSRFVKTTPDFHAGNINDTGGIYRALATVPFPYGVAFSELRRHKELSQCLNVGIVYGVYPQIMSGYSGRDVLASLDADHKYLNAQEQIHESWLTSSAKSIGLSGSTCVIVGFLDGQTSVIRDLLANHWKIRNRFTDNAYQTDVFILTR